MSSSAFNPEATAPISSRSAARAAARASAAPSRRPRGKQKHPGENALGYGQPSSGVGLARGVGLHAMAARMEVAAGEDPFGPQDREHVVPIEAGDRGIDLEGDVMVVPAVSRAGS